MQMFKTPNINFIGNRNKAFVFSGLLLFITFASLVFHKGPNLSIDFLGGTVVQFKFEKPVVDDMDKIKSIVNNLGYGVPEIKRVGPVVDNEIQIIVKKKSKGSMVGDEIKRVLSEKYSENPFELRREEQVGPKVGGELKQKGLLAILLSMFGIVIYIGIRFHLPFGVAAIIALIHDVFITIGVFSIFRAEISLPIIGALLTIVGYSLNDTIVVFDRIRENLGGANSKKSFEDRLNKSINECLSRTIITSLTTLAVVVIIFIFFLGTGDVLLNFSGALISGILIGTYSSIFIASPVLILWNKKWPIK